MSQQINLFNPAFLQQKHHFSSRAMLQALALLMLGAGAIYGYASHQVGMMERQKHEMEKRLTLEQARLAGLTREFSPERSSLSLQDELKRIEAESAAQQRLLDTLKSGVMGNTEGYSEYMRAFARQAVGGLWLTGFLIEGDGKHMSLEGAALGPQLVPAYIQRLRKEKVMQGKTFAALQIRLPKSSSSQATAGDYVEFSMHSDEASGDAK